MGNLVRGLLVDDVQHVQVIGRVPLLPGVIVVGVALVGVAFIGVGVAIAVGEDVRLRASFGKSSSQVGRSSDRQARQVHTTVVGIALVGFAVIGIGVAVAVG
eukprot:4663623-Heterocapsa_arctica.AAC.1